MDRSVIVGMAAARPGHPIRHLRLAGVLALTAALGTSGTGLAQSPNVDEGGPTPPPFTAESYDIGGRSLFMVCVGPADSALPTRREVMSTIWIMRS